MAAQPAYDMGRTATQFLLARLAGKASDECQEIILPVEMIVRHSSGKRVSLFKLLESELMYVYHD